ncbi:MAG: ABC transporter permease [Candidatus Promineifilaceae bacterium]|jgi:simple sugar transport system permease protein
MDSDLGSILAVVFAAGTLNLAVATATPIALGAFAGLFSERSGVVNIAIEGMMLTAAMSAAFASAYTGSLYWGLIAALLSGALMAALHAVLSIRFKMNQIISGTVINFLAWGLTGHLYQTYLVPPHWPGSVGTLQNIEIPILSDIRIFDYDLGEIFFNQGPIVLTMLVLAFVIHYVLFYTPWGLRMRSVGEHPEAADTLGINVFFTRYTNVIIGGTLAGLAGAWMTLEWIDNFTIRMTTGRGFIALAALIFGRWTPFGALGAALLFGLANAIQIKLQIKLPDVPAELFQMLPYVLTIIVAALARPVPPKAVGQPYEKE